MSPNIFIESVEYSNFPDPVDIIELNMTEWFNLLTYGKLDLDFSLIEEDNSSVSKSRVAYTDPGSDTNTIYITF